MSAQEVLQLIMLGVNNKAITLNILNLQYLPENAEGLMSAIDVIDIFIFVFSCSLKSCGECRSCALKVSCF